MTRPVVLAAGMVTGVGHSAAATCAAHRAALRNFDETRFMDRGGAWIIGSQVEQGTPTRGRSKLLQMTAPAIREALSAAAGTRSEDIPLLISVAEPQRPARLDGLDESLLADLARQLGVRFHSASAVLAGGRVGGARLIEHATQLFDELNCKYCIVAGVDSLLSGPALRAFEDSDRLFTISNSNGFIHGEAAAAVLIGRDSPGSVRCLVCLGIGFGIERATVLSEEPLRADGLVQAVREASGLDSTRLGVVRYRFCDANGEQYAFKEAALVLTR